MKTGPFSRSATKQRMHRSAIRIRMCGPISRSCQWQNVCLCPPSREISWPEFSREETDYVG